MYHRLVRDEIYTYARSSDHMDESKSTRLLRFRLVLEEDARAFRSQSKMKKKLEEYRQSQSNRVLFGIDGESIEFEWKILPGLTSLEIFQTTQRICKIKTLLSTSQTPLPMTGINRPSRAPLHGGLQFGRLTPRAHT